MGTVGVYNRVPPSCTALRDPLITLFYRLAHGRAQKTKVTAKEDAERKGKGQRLPKCPTAAQAEQNHTK